MRTTLPQLIELHFPHGVNVATVTAFPWLDFWTPMLDGGLSDDFFWLLRLTIAYLKASGLTYNAMKEDKRLFMILHLAYSAKLLSVSSDIRFWVRLSYVHVSSVNGGRLLQ